MSSLADEFLESLKQKPQDQQDLIVACKLLEVCRDYVAIHFKNAVYGSYQKNLLEVLNNFLDDQESKRVKNESKFD